MYKRQDYGAILVKLCVPDKDGELTDVVLGYDDVQQYEVNGCFFGAIIGRSGNRIAGARFSLYGQEYQLDKNENYNNHMFIRDSTSSVSTK